MLVAPLQAWRQVCLCGRHRTCSMLWPTRLPIASYFLRGCRRYFSPSSAPLSATSLPFLIVLVSACLPPSKKETRRKKHHTRRATGGEQGCGDDQGANFPFSEYRYAPKTNMAMQGGGGMKVFRGSVDAKILNSSWGSTQATQRDKTRRGQRGGAEREPASLWHS